MLPTCRDIDTGRLLDPVADRYGHAEIWRQAPVANPTRLHGVAETAG